MSVLLPKDGCDASYRGGKDFKCSWLNFHEDLLITLLCLKHSSEQAARGIIRFPMLRPAAPFLKHRSILFFLLLLYLNMKKFEEK